MIIHGDRAAHHSRAITAPGASAPPGGCSGDKLTAGAGPEPAGLRWEGRWTQQQTQPLPSGAPKQSGQGLGIWGAPAGGGHLPRASRLT